MSKKNRKNTQKKPRSYDITLDMGRPVEANGVYFDPKCGQVLLLKNGRVLTPQSAVVKQSYARAEKADKILNTIPTNPNQLFINPNRVLDQFDEIYAIDTNTRSFHSGIVSISGIVGGKNTQIQIPKSTSIAYRPLYCFEFHDIEGKPENLAWMELINAIRRHPSHNSNKKYAIVVDSDLGLIPDYNARKLPIFSDFFLPEGFCLAYASSESGGENIANKMLTLADKISSEIFKLLKQQWVEDGLQAVKGQPYKQSRMWTP